MKYPNGSLVTVSQESVDYGAPQWMVGVVFRVVKQCRDSEVIIIPVAGGDPVQISIIALDRAPIMEDEWDKITRPSPLPPL